MQPKVIRNAKMSEVLAEVANKLFSSKYSDNITDFSKKVLQNVIDNKNAEDYLKVEFGIGKSVYNDCAIYLTFDECDNNLELSEDENGNLYKDYTFSPKIGLSSNELIAIGEAEEKINLMLIVLEISKELSLLYKDTIIRHIHFSAEKIKRIKLS